MSSIKSLGISGIRNFAPGEEKKPIQTIEFTEPLTLILGANGTGKTTIIESLKYATTGDLPPGSGASFVHNPSLASEKSVKGFVKAEITNTQGDSLTVIRSGQCTSKGDKKEFKTLESTVSWKIKDTKKETSKTYEKLEDVNCEMEKALGVSKAILNNIIFCHQEDSTWPLEDGKKLKERFDRIFDSERYNQAIESITKYSKTLKDVKLSNLKTNEEKLEENLKEAIQKQKDLDEFEKQLTNYKDEVSEVSKKIASLNEAKKKLDETKTEYEKLSTMKENKVTELRALNKYLGELKNDIQTNYGGTIEEKEIGAVDAGSIEIKSETETVNTLVNQLDLIDSKLKKENANVDKLVKSFGASSVKKETEQEIKIPDEMESNSNKINEEVKTLQHSSTEAKLELIKTALATKENDIHELRNKHEDLLKMLLKVEVFPQENLEVSLDRIHKRLTDQREELNNKLHEKKYLEKMKVDQERVLQKNNDEFEATQGKIKLMCQDKEYHEVLRFTKKTLQDFRNTKEIYASKSIVYKGFIEKLESCCPLCHRNYDNQQDYEQFKSELNDEVNKYSDQLKMYEEKLKVQQEQYDSLLQLQPYVDKVEELEKEMVELKQNQNESEKKLAELNEQIEKLQSEIRESESEFAQCKNMEMSRQMIDELEIDKNKASKQMTEIRYRVSMQETRKREISVNETLKEKTAEAHKLQDEIDKLSKELDNMNHEDLVKEIKNHGKEVEDLTEKKSAAIGHQKVLEGKIEVLENDLNMDKYKFAKRNYIKNRIEIDVRKQAVDNLSAYITALDKAIIDFHKERMMSVNKILSDLWEIIYKGKDTTAIQIVPNVTESGKHKRTYHYEVVQVKQTVTMNMKAQCSAGQKVLASIIIRIALAQTFAKNCGVLALDEPTTNLDESNMMGLAKALTRLVATRSKYQKNFQLIVISHDENFVNELFRQNRIVTVWKLLRNAEQRTEFDREHHQFNRNASNEEESNGENQSSA